MESTPSQSCLFPLALLGRVFPVEQQRFSITGDIISLAF